MGSQESISIYTSSNCILCPPRCKNDLVRSMPQNQDLFFKLSVTERVILQAVQLLLPEQSKIGEVEGLIE